METISGVYKITNLLNGKSYIGSTKDFSMRFREHRRKKNWIKYKNEMYWDMYKQGIETFKFEILCTCSEDTLKNEEQYWIDKLKPYYNRIRANGNSGETAEKRREYARKYRENNREKVNLSSWKSKHSQKQILTT